MFFRGEYEVIIYVILKQEKLHEGYKRLLELTMSSVIVETYTEIPSYIPERVKLIIVEPLFTEERNIEKIIRLAKGDLPVCTISEYMTNEELLEIMSIKVRGILFKSMSTVELKDALERIMYGEYYIPPKAAGLLLEAYQK